MKIKMNITDLFDKVVEIINNLSEAKQCPRCGEQIEIESEIENQLFSLDVGFDIALEYIKDIANRAIILDDPVILEDLQNLGVVKCAKEDEKEYIKKAKEIRKQIKMEE